MDYWQLILRTNILEVQWINENILNCKNKISMYPISICSPKKGSGRKWIKKARHDNTRNICISINWSNVWNISMKKSEIFYKRGGWYPSFVFTWNYLNTIITIVGRQKHTNFDSQENNKERRWPRDLGEIMNPRQLFMFLLLCLSLKMKKKCHNTLLEPTY